MERDAAEDVERDRLVAAVAALSLSFSASAPRVAARSKSLCWSALTAIRCQHVRGSLVVPGLEEELPGAHVFSLGEVAPGRHVVRRAVHTHGPRPQARVHVLVGALEEQLDPALSAHRVAHREVQLESPDQLQAALDLARGERPGERGLDVAVLRLHELRPLHTARFLGEIRFLAEVDQMLEQAARTARPARPRAAAPRRTRGSSRACRSAPRPSDGSGSCPRATRARRGRRRKRPRRRRASSRRERPREPSSSRCSSGVSSSYDHSIVARSVRCRASASRPPLRRSRRPPSRSSSCSVVRTDVRAAASSIASGRSSRRAQSSSTCSSGRKRGELASARVTNSARASGRARTSTAYTCSPWTRSRSRLVTRTSRRGQAPSSGARSVAAPITCSKLSSSNSIRRSPIVSASGPLPNTREALGRTAAASVIEASGTHQTPCGYSSAAAAAAWRASRVLPLPPGP